MFAQLSEWWLDVAYLRSRTPLPVYSNTGMVFPKCQINSDSDRLKIAATYVAAVLCFKDKLYE